MGRASKLRKSRFSSVSKSKVKKGSSSGIIRGTGTSGAEVLIEEAERIEGYIRQEHLNRIVDESSARDAMNSLRTNPSSGDTTDFENLLRGAGRDGKNSFTQHLFDKYGELRQETIKDNDIQLKSGKSRKGFKLNRDIYLIVIPTKTGKEYVQARSFKTGRAVKINRSFLKRVR